MCEEVNLWLSLMKPDQTVQCACVCLCVNVQFHSLVCPQTGPPPAIRRVKGAFLIDYSAVSTCFALSVRGRQVMNFSDGCLLQRGEAYWCDAQWPLAAPKALPHLITKSISYQNEMLFCCFDETARHQVWIKSCSLRDDTWALFSRWTWHDNHQSWFKSPGTESLDPSNV